MNKQLKQITKELSINAKAVAKSLKDLEHLIESSAMLVTIASSFWFGYTHDFQLDLMRYVVCGSAILTGLVMASIYLKNKRKELEQ